MRIVTWHNPRSSTRLRDFGRDLVRLIHHPFFALALLTVAVSTGCCGLGGMVLRSVTDGVTALTWLYVLPLQVLTALTPAVLIMGGYLGALSLLRVGTTEAGTEEVPC